MKIKKGDKIPEAKIFVIDMSKEYNNRMELTLKTMMDRVHSGALMEFGVGYKINESLNSYFSVTNIVGDNSQDDTYEFNHMEDFSHIRMELKYYY